MKIVISGASGLIGKSLVSQLQQHGHDVVRLVRRAANAGEIMWDPKAGVLDSSALEGTDAVIHLSGAASVTSDGHRHTSAKFWKAARSLQV